MSEVPTAWIEDMRKWLEDDFPMTFDDWCDDGPGMPDTTALRPAGDADLDTLTECARMASENLDTCVCETGAKEL